MTSYLGEIVEINSKSITTTEGKKVTLDEYHKDLPYRKGDSVLLSGNKLLFMIPNNRKSVEESIKNPISGISPVFAKMIISESDKVIERDSFSPEIPRDKILSSFFNMISWKEFYFNHRGSLFREILNNNVPNVQIQKFIKYWLDEHLLRQFSLWGLSVNETKIMIEDVSITNSGKIDIEDLFIIISKTPGRFLYVHPDIDENKIKHLTQIFNAEEMPYEIKCIKRDLMKSPDSYITFTDKIKTSIGKYIGVIGKYGLIVFDNNNKISLISTYNIETDVSKYIIGKIKKCDYTWKEKNHRLCLKHEDLSTEQKDGIRMVFSNQVSIITGGPGTGKTKLIHGVIQEAISKGIPYHVAAFTGKAVGRVKETAYPEVIESSTIDMMLVQGPNHYKFNLLILEEASMITTKYMYRLFKKFNPLIYRIVLVGDLDQIPPIDKGQCFSSLIWSKRVPYIRLTRNFRVDSSIGGEIIRNASMIVDPLRNLKEPIDLDAESKSFNILKGDLIFLKTILRKIDSTTIDSLTIMTPYNSDVNSINKIFQDIKYSRTDDYIQDKFTKWYEGDRIMITENNLKEDLANGDLGSITSIANNKIHVCLDKDEVRRTFTLETSNVLKHSYCFTINKSQGSEYDAIILYLPTRSTNDFFLNMNLVYTAITRARKMVWIIVEDINVLVNACNKRLPLPKDVLKESLIKSFEKQEYIGTLVPVEEIPCDDDYSDIDDYY
jgi:hypothetical protein